MIEPLKGAVEPAKARLLDDEEVDALRDVVQQDMTVLDAEDDD